MFDYKGFQEAEILHLLAINSLQISLINRISLGLERSLGCHSIRFQEHPRFYAFSQLIYPSGILLYQLLVVMPALEYITIFMDNLLISGRLLGQVHQPLYALFFWYFFFIFPNPAFI